jgi:hypothetical protein
MHEAGQRIYVWWMSTQGYRILAQPCFANQQLKMVDDESASCGKQGVVAVVRGRLVV